MGLRSRVSQWLQDFRDPYPDELYRHMGGTDPSQPLDQDPALSFEEMLAIRVYLIQRYRLEETEGKDALIYPARLFWQFGSQGPDLADAELLTDPHWVRAVTSRWQAPGASGVDRVHVDPLQRGLARWAAAVGEGAPPEADVAQARAQLKQMYRSYGWDWPGSHLEEAIAALDEGSDHSPAAKTIRESASIEWVLPPSDQITDHEPPGVAAPGMMRSTQKQESDGARLNAESLPAEPSTSSDALDRLRKAQGAAKPIQRRARAPPAEETPHQEVRPTRPPPSPDLNM